MQSHKVKTATSCLLAWGRTHTRHKHTNSFTQKETGHTPGLILKMVKQYNCGNIANLRVVSINCCTRIGYKYLANTYNIATYKSLYMHVTI